MQELNARIEQTGKKKWVAVVGASEDINNQYWRDNNKVIVFEGKTEKQVIDKANKYADEKAVEQARKEAVYTIELTRGLLESPEKKSTTERTRELKYKNSTPQGLTKEEFKELQGLVN